MLLLKETESGRRRLWRRAENGCDGHIYVGCCHYACRVVREQMRNICMCMRRVAERVVGRVKKRHAQEVGKTTLHCAGFLSGGVKRDLF